MRHTFFDRYRKALLVYLKKPEGSMPQSAHELGREALKTGLQASGMARLHEQILVKSILPEWPVSARAGLVKQAATFFAAAIAKKGMSKAQSAGLGRTDIVAMLSERSVALAAANLDLEQEITQRKNAEDALKKSEHHYSHLLQASARLQERLRQLSRQILSAQEDERKRISRELHDVIAQSLTGINLRLVTLKNEARHNEKGLDRCIARTQRMVEKSVSMVHRFARELRPAALDDLGLIPALHSFLKQFAARTGLRTKLTAFAGVEQLSMARRTALFRVTQEALMNVARHAEATRVEVSLQRVYRHARMEITDDGKAFQVERHLSAEDNKRLGLLGMRERVEMVGGAFRINSAPGMGTTVRVDVPLAGAPAVALRQAPRTTLKS